MAQHVLGAEKRGPECSRRSFGRCHIQCLGSTPEKPGGALSKAGTGGVSSGGRSVHQVREKLETMGSSKNSSVLVGMERLLGRRLAENGGQTGSREPDDEGPSVLFEGACLVFPSQEQILNTLSKRMSLTGFQFDRW